MVFRKTDRGGSQISAQARKQKRIIRVLLPSVLLFVITATISSACGAGDRTGLTFARMETKEPAQGLEEAAPTLAPTLAPALTPSGRPDVDSAGVVPGQRHEAPVFLSSPVDLAVVGLPYIYAVKAQGMPALVYHLLESPQGMTIDPNSGLVAWMPEANGSFSVIIRASNPAGEAQQRYTVRSVDSLAEQCVVPPVDPGGDNIGRSQTPGNHDGGVVTVSQVFELSLKAASPGKTPYADGPEVRATFRGFSGPAQGQELVVPGFWDGKDVWKIRFSPLQAGEWAYETDSTDSGLDAISGSLTAVTPTPDELAENPLLHGFLQADGFAWKLSDGTPFLPVGDTQWSFAEENTLEEWERWMRARQAQGFNTFLGAFWMALYDRPEATKHPFPGKDPQKNDLQPAYFQRLDRMVQYANDHGIMMGLTIGGFTGNSDWFDRFGTRERNDRWFRYVVARYSAYNVRWVLYGESNEANPPWGGSWRDEVKHSAALVREVDPYDHPIGNHHTEVDHSSAADRSIDYIEVQSDRTEGQYKEAEALRKYGKPLWFEEYWYEPEVYDGEIDLGIRNTYRNFVAALAYPTMGSLMRAHYPDFEVDEIETDPGAIRMCYFSRFFAGLDAGAFGPASDLVDRGQAGRFGSSLVLFLQGGGSVTLNLSQEAGQFAVRALDIHTGEIVNLGTVDGGGKRKIDTGMDVDAAVLVFPAG